MDDILTNYPSLRSAYQQGKIEAQDIAEGVKRLHYEGDNDGLTSATCILRRVVKVREERVEIAYGNRLPILKSVIDNDLPDDGKSNEKIRNNISMWKKLGSYMKLDRDSIHDYDSFLIRAEENNHVIIPLNFARKRLYFRVEDPSIEIGNHRHINGHYDIQAVALFDKDEATNQSRVIINYSVDTDWSPESWRFITDKVNKLKQSIEEAFNRGEKGLSNVISVGAVSGKG